MRNIYDLCVDLNLDQNQPCQVLEDSDMDSYLLLSQRAWLIFKILDHEGTVATSEGTALVPDRKMGLYPVDGILLGTVGNHLARFARVLGHIDDHLMGPVPLLAAASVVSAEVELLSNVTTHPLFVRLPEVEVSNLYLQLICTRQSPSPSNRTVVANIALRMVALLRSINPQGNSLPPLFAHFAALAVLSLAEFMDLKLSSVNARQGLEDLRDVLQQDAVLLEFINKKLQSTGPRTGESTLDRNGLQHLADAAVGESEAGGGKEINEAPAHVDIWWPFSSTKGYMNSVL